MENIHERCKLWTVPQLASMIIYNSKRPILIQWIRVMNGMWQSDLVDTKERVLPVFDKHYHTNKRKVKTGEEIEFLRNWALPSKVRGRLAFVWPVTVYYHNFNYSIHNWRVTYNCFIICKFASNWTKIVGFNWVDSRDMTNFDSTW